MSDNEFKNVIPVHPGYYSLVSGRSAGAANGNQMRPVVAIAERSPGKYQACVINTDGRLDWAGVVHPEPESHLQKSASHNIHEIAQALKNLLTVAQERLRK